MNDGNASFVCCHVHAQTEPDFSARCKSSPVVKFQAMFLNLLTFLQPDSMLYSTWASGEMIEKKIEVEKNRS